MLRGNLNYRFQPSPEGDPSASTQRLGCPSGARRPRDRDYERMHTAQNLAILREQGGQPIQCQ
jgi:hypothetical protein